MVDVARVSASRQVVTYDDPRTLAIGILRGALAGKATVAGKLPSSRAAALAALPLVVVLSNGSTEVESNVVMTTTLRLTVYADDEDTAYDLAGLAQSVLDTRGSGPMGRCVPLTGPWTTVDPETELYLATATSRARTSSVAVDL